MSKEDSTTLNPRIEKAVPFRICVLFSREKENNTPVWPTWAVGALLRGARMCFNIEALYTVPVQRVYNVCETFLRRWHNGYTRGATDGLYSIDRGPTLGSFAGSFGGKWIIERQLTLLLFCCRVSIKACKRERSVLTSQGSERHDKQIETTSIAEPGDTTEYRCVK